MSRSVQLFGPQKSITQARRKKITTPFLFLSLALFLFQGVPAVYSLTFEEVIGTIEDTYEMQSARREIRRLEAEKKAASSPEDIRAALSPQGTVLSVVDGDTAEETRFTGAATLSLPFSLSAAEKDAVRTWQNSIAQAQSLASETYVNTYIRLFGLYQNLWLLQQEESVLANEVEASEVYLELMRERFRVGTVPLSTLALAEENLTERQENLITNRLEQRLAWFELSRLTGITAVGDGGTAPGSSSGTTTGSAGTSLTPAPGLASSQFPLPRLEPVKLQVKLRADDIPAPPEMEGWIVENHPVLVRERIGITQLRQNLDSLLKPDYDLSVKSFLNYQDHSVSLTWNLVDPEITAAYNFPIFSLGELPVSSGSSLETWNTGLGISLSYGSNRNDRLKAEAQAISLEEEQAKIEYLTQQSLLNVRSAYQQLLKSLELVDQASRTLDRSKETRKIVEAKRDLDQSPRHEVLESTAAEARAAWKIEQARIAAEKAYLTLLKESAMFEEKM